MPNFQFKAFGCLAADDQFRAAQQRSGRRGQWFLRHIDVRAQCQHVATLTFSSFAWSPYGEHVRQTAPNRHQLAPPTTLKFTDSC